jgi:hypothetical protein
MNQDQIKKILLSIRPAEEEFSVILSGKKSGKVNGLYKPESREIIIHNKNFKNDNEMMYTAIHEFAHHLQFTTSSVPISVRTHTTAFWSLFHSLLFEAEKKGTYLNPFESIDAFRSLTREIREKFITGSGSMMKELGRLLLRAHELCEEHGTSFTDYVDRVLGLPRASARAITKAHALDLDPWVGFENMRSLAGIRDQGMREAAQEALIGGRSPDMVKAEYGTRKPPDARAQLVQEKNRIERTIERLKTRLSEVKKRLGQIEEE